MDKLHYELTLSIETIRRLERLSKGGDIEAQINALCQFAERSPYEFHNLPKKSWPRQRQFNTIRIGESRIYPAPLVDLPSFLNAVRCIGVKYKMVFTTDIVHAPICTVTVTRIA